MTSGNRRGYKTYSINTTIRNPSRNIEFLKELENFTGKYFDYGNKIKYYRTLIKKGIYKVSNLSETIQEKYRKGEELTEQEIDECILKNPQRTKDSGRVITQIRSLKDQGLVKFLGTKRKYIIEFTNLGLDFLSHQKAETDIYTKAMIGLEWGSVARDTTKNKAIPFLNTLFVLKKLEYSLQEKFKGITYFEFSVFILTMIDCNYENAAEEILAYREKYRFESNQEFAETYLHNHQILPIRMSSLTFDYPNDVFQKFKKTGLFSSRGNGRFIDLNQNEMTKINLILEKFQNYQWLSFDNVTDYYNHIDTIELPWENDILAQKKIIEQKAKKINYMIDYQQKSIEQLTEEIDGLFYQKIFAETSIHYEDELLVKELKLLANNTIEKSDFSEISEPLRLEWLITHLLANKMGKDKIKGNIKLGDDGFPNNYAPPKKADIEIEDDNNYFIVEVTMIKNKNQQLNAETSTVSRHLEDGIKTRSHKKYGALLIAPYIHRDTVDYYQYSSQKNNIPFIPLSIETFIKFMENCENINDFQKKLENYQEKSNSLDKNQYYLEINQ